MIKTVEQVFMRELPGLLLKAGYVITSIYVQPDRKTLTPLGGESGGDS